MIELLAQTAPTTFNIEQLGVGGVIAAAIVYATHMIIRATDKSRQTEHRLIEETRQAERKYLEETRQAERKHLETLVTSTSAIADKLVDGTSTNERAAKVMLECTLRQQEMLAASTQGGSK